MATNGRNEAEILLDNISEEEIEKLVDFFANKKGTLAELRGLTRDELEGIYAIAYAQLGQKHYEKAENLFGFLCLFDTYVKKNWMGLGVSRQMMQKYRTAVAAYLMSTSIDPGDPAPILKSAECFLAAGELDKAERAFKTSAHLASQDDKFVGMKAHAEAMLQAVEHRRGAPH